jgi:drug/metabolite transporter (DMT)-like permease
VTVFLCLYRYKTAAQLRKIAILSVVFCMSVVFGNMSLRYIPVSFNQAISATTPAFTAVLEYFVQEKVQSRTTYATLIPVVVGIVIASRFEPSFHMWGFLACMIATALRALKSVVQVSTKSVADIASL